MCWCTYLLCLRTTCYAIVLNHNREHMYLLTVRSLPSKMQAVSVILRISLKRSTFNEKTSVTECRLGEQQQYTFLNEPSPPPRTSVLRSLFSIQAYFHHARISLNSSSPVGTPSKKIDEYALPQQQVKGCALM